MVSLKRLSLEREDTRASQSEEVLVRKGGLCYDILVDVTRRLSNKAFQEQEFNQEFHFGLFLCVLINLPETADEPHIWH